MLTCAGGKITPEDITPRMHTAEERCSPEKTGALTYQWRIDTELLKHNIHYNEFS